MVKKMRKGFTLVELLIVIVIIGILAAALLLSSGSATDSAEASTIVSDLRSLASATMMWYGDNIDDTNIPDIASVAAYAANSAKYATGYVLVAATNADGWLVGNEAVTDKAGVRNKLRDRASAVGLFGSDDGTTVYSNQGEVYMFAR